MEVEIDLKKHGIGKVALLADDSPTLRKTVAAAFLSDGFKTCVEVENGKEAIEAAQQIRPDVIILDLSMPVMNGLEAAFELRKIVPTTPIIIFTMYAESLKKAAPNAVNLVLDKAEPLQNLIDKAHELIGS